MKNTWIKTKEKKPPFGKVVKCKIQHWYTMGLQEHEMIRVNADDHEWVTADDNSELDFNWNVIEWQDTEQP